MISGKKIVIIGGTGSLGNELTSHFGKDNDIFIYSRDELKQWEMRARFPNATFCIGDIRSKERMKNLLLRHMPDIIIIACAMKHIDVCEKNITECINTNTTGTANILSILNENKEFSLNRLKVLFVSTDKACSPCTAYGMSKSLSERLMAEASLYEEKNRITYLCVRYGNVLNSRGSLIPKLLEICKKGEKYISLTHEDMTRFFMTIENSVDLIEKCLIYGQSGETWIPCLKSFKIKDMMELFAAKYNLEIKITGIRLGEKIHECLLNDEELKRTYVNNLSNKNYFVIQSCYTSNYENKHNFTEYSSSNTSDVSILKEILSKSLSINL